jgi:hypothetical protein
VGRSDCLDDFPGPVEVFAAPARCVGDVAQVHCLVGELDQFRRVAEMPGVFDLGALALGLGQRLVVGDLLDDLAHARAAQPLDLGRALGFLRSVVGAVLDHVVEHGGAQHVGIGDLRLQLGTQLLFRQEQGQFGFPLARG